MGQNRCSYEEAFKILSAASSRRNIKIRVLARSLLEDLSGGTPSAISKDEQGIRRSGRTVMTRDDWNARPLLDQAELDWLRDELDDDEGVWKIFIQNFIAQLPHRTETLRMSLTTGDLAGALDAALSLKSSGQMVGADRLGGLALELEQSLRTEDCQTDPATALPRLAAAHLSRIIDCNRQTTLLLQKYIA